MAQSKEAAGTAKGAPAGTSEPPKKQEAEAPAEGSGEEQETPDARLRRAEGIVRRNVYIALGVGIIPIPILDLLGLTSVALKMIKELSDVYGVSYKENAAKSIISSLTVSIGSIGIAGAVAGSLIKLIPAVGHVVSVVSVAAVAGAFMQALGNAFIMHFETGGSILDFNVDKMRVFFQKEFEKAKSAVSQLPKEEQGKTQTKASA